ncbi:M23 family metallopeptidase [Neobacillus dielmonensis]|uniref:M23 family metallopeptidase n=1 Tax=Neobacillus dielmonensis TaxID=1347369 RepID=UPI0005A96640|nr:M23 family metallopeptidase [Neobacillus dielmonensis]
MREEENKRSSQSSSVKRFFKKRWVFPAIYIASAAIILTGVLWYQSSAGDSDKYSYKSSDLTGKKNQTPAVEVNSALENVKMPVANAKNAEIKTKFYDFNAKAEDQEAALVFYNNTYQPNTGIDITVKGGETFDVTASLSGTVTRVEEDAILGNVIEIEHDNGIVTQYQSVKDIKVKAGEEVKQGDVLAKAGQSLFNEKAGTHVHFEIRKDGVAVNPSDYFNKPLNTLQEDKQSESVDTPKAKEDQQKIDDSQGAEDDPAADTESDDDSTDSKTGDDSTDSNSGDQPSNDGQSTNKSKNS